MPLHTFKSEPPPLFLRTPPPLARLGVVGVLSVFLMATDSYLQISGHIRGAVASVLTPLQWIGSQPVKAVNLLGTYVTTVESAKQSKEQATIALAQQALKAQRAELLARENSSLRQLLGLQQQLPLQARAAQVVHIAPDPFIRKVVIDKGSYHGVIQGSPVIDEHGLVGQVVRVFPLSSEITLLNNTQHATPALNNRTGERFLVYGDSKAPDSNALEIRFLSNTADIQVGDMISSSGTDGVYPAGLPIGQVASVEKHSAFLRVQVSPAAKLRSVEYVLAIDPTEPIQTDAPPLLGTPNTKPARTGSRPAAAQGGRP